MRFLLFSLTFLALNLGLCKTYFELPLRVVQFKHLNWTQEEILFRIERTQNIFSKCNIRPVISVFLEVNLPKDALDLSPPHDQNVASSLSSIPNLATIYFSQSNFISQAYGLDEFAENSPRKSLENSAWMSFDVTSKQYQSAVSKDYEPVAHEIAHLLCNCHHVEDGTSNLFASASHLLSSELTEAQCEDFKKSPLIRSIVTQ